MGEFSYKMNIDTYAVILAFYREQEDKIYVLNSQKHK